MVDAKNVPEVAVSDGHGHGYSSGSSLGTWDVVAVVGYFIVILVVSSLSMLRKESKLSVWIFFGWTSHDLAPCRLLSLCQ